MPNVYFNNFAASQEQDLIESLVVESISIYGIETFYLPRTLQNKDKVYGEDTQTSTYTNAYNCDMYVKSVDGFQGDADFMSKFGMEIRDQMTWTIARRTFGIDVAGQAAATTGLALERPREGDLIYFPLNGKLFEIKFVEHEPVFYQMGALQMWDCRCELFEYNGEIFSTGITDVDKLTTGGFSTDLWQHSILLPSGGRLLDARGYPIVLPNWDIELSDVQAENTTIETEADTIIDFSEADPFSEGGTF